MATHALYLTPQAEQPKAQALFSCLHPPLSGVEHGRAFWGLSGGSARVATSLKMARERSDMLVVASSPPLPPSDASKNRWGERKEDEKNDAGDDEGGAPARDAAAPNIDEEKGEEEEEEDASSMLSSRVKAFEQVPRHLL